MNRMRLVALQLGCVRILTMKLVCFLVALHLKFAFSSSLCTAFAAVNLGWKGGTLVPAPSSQQYKDADGQQDDEQGNSYANTGSCTG